MIFIKHTSGRDAPLGTDDEGIPLADFLGTLQVPPAGAEDEEEDDDEDDEDAYSGFISAIVAGEDLPSEDEEDEDHDADNDADEDYDDEAGEGEGDD